MCIKKANDGRRLWAKNFILPYKNDNNDLITNAKKLQALGIDLDKMRYNVFESGKRFVTASELRMFAKALSISYSDLLD